MITLHHLENSRSQRILWLLEELGLDYQIQRYQRDPKTSLAPEALTRIHPLGYAPVIDDDGRVIAESGAIVEYLLQRYDSTGQLSVAPGSDDWLQCCYWMHYAEGSIMPMLVLKLVCNRVQSAKMPFLIRPVAKGIAGKVMGTFVQPALERHLPFIDTQLNGRRYFLGERLSGADFMMIFALEAAAERDNVADKYPAIEAYLTRIHALPAYQRGLEKGGPYDLLAG